MIRSRVLLSIVVVMLFGALALQAQPEAAAQDATPSAGMTMEGITFTLVGVVPSATLASPAEMQVARTGFDPGKGFAFDPNDPSGALVIIESGALTVRVDEQSWTISRGGALQEAMAAAAAAPDMSGVLEEIAKGEDATLEVGDVAYVPGGINGEVRNAGQEQAEALIVIVGPEGMMMGMSGEATPAP